MCRSTPTPWSVAVCRKNSVASADRPSSRGAGIHRRGRPLLRVHRPSSARWSAASGPTTGHPHSATISTSMTSTTVGDLGERLDAAQAVLGCRVGVGADRSVAVAGHQPRRPFGSLDRLVDFSRCRFAFMAVIAPIRSPVSFWICSARNALSRWACGSTAAGTTIHPASSMTVDRRPTGRSVPDLGDRAVHDANVWIRPCDVRREQSLPAVGACWTCARS